MWPVKEWRTCSLPSGVCLFLSSSAGLVPWKAAKCSRQENNMLEFLSLVSEQGFIIISRKAWTMTIITKQGLLHPNSQDYINPEDTSPFNLGICLKGKQSIPLKGLNWGHLLILPSLFFSYPFWPFLPSFLLLYSLIFICFPFLMKQRL